MYHYWSLLNFFCPYQNLKSVSFGNILWHHQNLWEVPANVDNIFVLFATHNFTNSSLFNVCFYLTIGSLSQKNCTVVCYSIEKWFRLGSSLQSTCQSKRSRPSTYLGRWSLYWPQVLGRLFAPSQKSKKLSHHFRVCFELDFGILNAPRKIFWGVSGPIWELQRFEAVKFQGIKCFTKMASNFSEINFGFTYHEKMNRKKQ